MGMLCRSVDLMREGRGRGYAVPAYDTFNYESTKMVFEAAEKAGTPVIIMYYNDGYIPMDTFAVMVKDLGARSSVPFSVHLDHSPDFETCMRAIRSGFTSIMLDASKLPFDENVKETRRVVQAARPLGIDVEGELGIVGREEKVDRNRFTQPGEARRFAEETGVDSLAVAIGNSHGVYIEEPRLEIELLTGIAAAADLPLVLHGTSMIPVDQLKEAVRHGITKTNIATEYLMYYRDELARILAGDNPPKVIGALLEAAHGPVVDFIAEKMRVLNPDGLTLL
ncbi:MAG: class II fructose-bisphosphate aldolase [Treponema sp.]|jgi:ketose-bisphosphate aldolase|nr:class II fructose-bisphosphate aldolase [Treponema sp.]